MGSLLQSDLSAVKKTKFSHQNSLLLSLLIMALSLSSMFRGSCSNLVRRQSTAFNSILPSLSTLNHDCMHRISATSFTTAAKSYQHVLTEKRDNNIGLITLNRPTALNALCKDLLDEIVDALETFEGDDDISAIIITGSGGTRCLYIVH